MATHVGPPGDRGWGTRLTPWLAGLGWLVLTETGLLGLPAAALAQPAVEVLIARGYVRASGIPVTVTDTFAACDPRGAFTLVVENGPGGEPQVSSATVQVNGITVLQSSDFSSDVRRLERPLTSMQATNSLKVQLASQPGGTMAVSVLAVQVCGPRITSPAPGTALAATEVLVEGGIPSSAAPGSSVVVNGILAAVAGQRFAARVPVDAETSTLTAVLLDASGRPQGSHSIEVRTAAVLAPQALRLVPLPAHGVAPLEVRFDLALVGGRIAHVALGLEGGHSVDFEGSTLADRAFLYRGPGLYFPTVTVVDEAGTTHAAAAILLVEDPAAVTARFQGLWTDFSDRLAAGDTQGALALVAPSLQARLTGVLAALGPDLPAIVRGFGRIEVTDQVGSLAEAVLTQQDGGLTALHFLYFRRDSLGRWLIEEM